jgi:tyrosinase
MRREKAMQYTRKNLWELGNDWADPILWYARGVAAMKKRTLVDPTSWRFYGAIHGFNQQLWQLLGDFSSSDPKPTPEDVKRYWKQCQHGSWFFLPWHRGYLLALEANIREEISKISGAPTDWALPYWNYFKPNENKLPPAFASPDWPDGHGNNPLFVQQRYGPNNDGKVFVPLQYVNLKAMNDHEFTGPGTGSSPGFGGIDTGFEHGGPTHGGVEQQPHDIVHGLVGGGTRAKPGAMSIPDSAGLDPIFYLHHANIDRLWEVWRRNPLSKGNPTDPKWLKGPESIGERKFSMPMPGGKPWDYTPSEMTDLGKLGYTYDDLSPAVPAVQPFERLQRLGAPAAAARATEGATLVASSKNVELVGASRDSVKIAGSEARASVQLDRNVRRKITASLSAAADAAVPQAAAPDRVFLNLENVRGLDDATAFQVYLNSPGQPEQLAGSVGLFGVSKATLTDEEHAGQGLNLPLEITDIVDALHLKNAFDVDAIQVRIVPVRPVPEDAQVSIGRVSIFREGR